LRRLTELRAGEYYVAARATDIPERRQTPDFLAGLVQGAVKVNLAKATTQRADLVIKIH
jgi:hypothetical protein